MRPDPMMRRASLIATVFASGLMATALLAGSAWAADAPPRRVRGYSIAPGTPATVGQGGAVIGPGSNRAVPAPRGSMATFGGLFGTGAPRASSPNPAPAPGR